MAEVTRSMLPWLEPVWQRLRGLQQAGRLPQALMLTGPPGVGRRRLARRLAQAGLCRQEDQPEPCGSCAGCRPFSAGAHPDYLEIGLLEDKREILIDQVRALSDSLHLTASQRQGRYALIRDADKLTLAAANALLKTLEEPPPGVTLLLTVARPSRVPATIRSRCQLWRVPVPEPEAAHAWLADQAPEAADDYRGRWEGPLAPLARLAQGQAPATRSWESLVDGVLQGQDPLAAAAALDTEGAGEFMLWWQTWLLDGMRAGRLGPEYRRLWDALLRVRSGGEGRYNRLLTLEGLFILFANLAAARSPAPP